VAVLETEARVDSVSQYPVLPSQADKGRLVRLSGIPGTRAFAGTTAARGTVTLGLRSRESRTFRRAAVPVLTQYRAAEEGDRLAVGSCARKGFRPQPVSRNPGDGLRGRAAGRRPERGRDSEPP